MPYQRSLTIVAPVREGAEDDVESLLGTMGNGVANGSVIDFGALEDVHFARLIMAPADSDHSGGRLPASVILLSDFDVTVDAHLEQLVEAAGPGIDQVFGRCEGYPEGAPTARDRLDYLRRHVVQEAARYVNTSGRTVRQIRQESALRDAIEAALDDPGRSWHGRDPSDVRSSGERRKRLRRASRSRYRPGADASSPFVGPTPSASRGGDRFPATTRPEQR